MFFQGEAMDEEYWEEMSAYYSLQEEPVLSETKEDVCITVEWQDPEDKDVVHHFYAREIEREGFLVVEVVVLVLDEFSEDQVEFYFVLSHDITLNDIHDNIYGCDLEEAAMYISSCEKQVPVRKTHRGKTF